MAREEIKINDLNVDVNYSKILIEALHADTVLIPGLTYSTDTFEKAGKLYFHKQTKDTIVAGAPGRNFSDVDVADSIKELPFNQNFQTSKKIYNSQIASVAYDVVASQVDLAGRAIGLATQRVGLVHLVKDATPIYSTGTTIDDTEVTSANIKTYIINTRKKLKDAGASMDYIIVSTSVYAAMLGDTTNFAPSLNEERLREGVVGRYLGANVLEMNCAAADILINGDSEHKFDLTKVDFIAGQTNAFYIGKNIEMLRLKEPSNSNSILVQAETNAGYMVAHKDGVVVKFNSDAFQAAA